MDFAYISTSFNLKIIDFLLLILCLLAVLYYCYGIWAAIAFFSHPHRVDPNFHPPITILKPICGWDSNAYENLASFCLQDYPVYQIIFSVRDPQDVGVAVVPGTSFFSKPELGRSFIRFCFSKKPETLLAARERLLKLQPNLQPTS